jgi:RNA polymerase sigma-70 factor (ECF subfamily)
MTDDGNGPDGASDTKELLTLAYEAYADSLYRYALMVVADSQAAEDAVHQAFVRVMQKGSEMRQVEHLGQYLRIAVRNECYRVVTRHRVFTGLLKRLSSRPILESADHEMTHEDERRRVEKAIRRLPAEQREVLHLKVYEGQTFQAIAELTGVSINTAASRYRYAIDRLRRAMGLAATQDLGYRR